MLDPQVQALLTALDSAGAVPLVRGSAVETRAHYRELAMARRGPGFVPEEVAEFADGRGGVPDQTHHHRRSTGHPARPRRNQKNSATNGTIRPPSP